MPMRWSRKSDGSARLLIFGIEGDHRNEEKHSRKHRERAGDDAGNDCVAAAHQVAQHGQNNDRADDVVADVGDAADSPAVDLRMSGECARNTIAERDQGDHDEDRIDPVEEVRNVAEQPLDCVISESHDSGNPTP